MKLDDPKLMTLSSDTNARGATSASMTRTATIQKRTGAHYTPGALAGFVADRILKHYESGSSVSILDPAMGDGVLLEAICESFGRRAQEMSVRLVGFDTNPETLHVAKARVQDRFPSVPLDLRISDFLIFCQEAGSVHSELPLFGGPEFDVVIANPPYVRTQVLGAAKAQELASNFGLTGRVDLSSAFIMGIAKVLREGGVAGIIVSNRFMKTKAGAPVREYIAEHFDILEVWDFGDTKLFNAAVLPVVLILRKSYGGSRGKQISFATIYTSESNGGAVSTPSVFDAIMTAGKYTLGNGQAYDVHTGRFGIPENPASTWRLSTTSQDEWIDRILDNTVMRFGDIGKIRVGVKTTADSVFIRPNWLQAPEETRPELVLPLITHHGAERWRMRERQLRGILYTHEIRDGKRRPVELERYPKSMQYLEEHRDALVQRKYVIDAGRNWFEIWVPQDPNAWKMPKMVFRDISETPTFWLDLEGAVVNGDCYWLAVEGSQDPSLLWLALAIANSRFIEEFYDRMFNNKLYAGRRRFMTQYVELFPVCDPSTPEARELITRAKRLHANFGEESHEESVARENLVRLAFGVAN